MLPKVSFYSNVYMANTVIHHLDCPEIKDLLPQLLRVCQWTAFSSQPHQGMHLSCNEPSHPKPLPKQPISRGWVIVEYEDLTICLNSGQPEWQLKCSPSGSPRFLLALNHISTSSIQSSLFHQCGSQGHSLINVLHMSHINTISELALQQPNAQWDFYEQWAKNNTANWLSYPKSIETITKQYKISHLEAQVTAQAALLVSRIITKIVSHSIILISNNS